VLIPDQQFRKRDEAFAEQRNHNHDEYYTLNDFTYNEADNSYTCPAGKTLASKKVQDIRGKPMLKWQAAVGDCRECPLKEKCMKIQKRGNKRGSKKTILLADRGGKENLSEKMWAHKCA
jgi:hypothetical protein